MRKLGTGRAYTEAAKVATLARPITSPGAGTNAATLEGHPASHFLGPQYIVLTADANLTGERILTAGDGLDLADGGAGANATLAVDVTDFIDTSYGLTESSNNIRINAGTGITFNTGTVIVDQAFSPTWTGQHQFNRGVLVDGSANEVQLTIQGNSTQTANVVEIEDYSGDVKSGADARGILFSHGGTDSTNVYIGNSGNPSGETGSGRNVGIGTDVLESVTTGGWNVGIGSQALQLLTTGIYNLGLGEGALNKITTGSYNVAVGRTALANCTGASNVAIGSLAGYTQTADSSNVYIGYESGYGNNNGNSTTQNIFIGASAGRNATTAWWNTIIGYQAGYNMAAGAINTFLGYQAGYGATGNHNTFIGYKAGYSEIGSYKLYISNDTTNLPLIYGEFNNKLVKINGRFDVAYDASNYASFSVGSGGDLTIDATGDDILIGASNTLSSAHWVSQTTGWGVSYAGAGDFRSLYADEMHVQAFIADIYQALVGAIIVTQSRARLSRNFTIPATSGTGTIYLEDLEGFEGSQVFTSGDYVCLRHIDTSGGGLVVSDVWGTVSAYSDLSGGEQSWTFTCTDDGGVSGSVVYAGSLALDYGQSGAGVWEATVLDSAGSPYSQVTTWDTDPSNPANFTTHVRIGNLDGISGIGAEYGLWAGQGATVNDAQVLISDSSAVLRNLSLYVTSSSTNRIILDASTPYLSVGSTAPTGYLSGDGFWVGSDSGTYKMHLGDVDGESLRWNGSTLNIHGDNNNYISMNGTYIQFFNNSVEFIILNGTTGGGRFGPYADSNVVVNSTGVLLQDNGVTRGEWQTDGDVFIGSDISSPGTTYLSVFANAQTYNSESMGAGDMLIGDNSASKANILWDYSAGRMLFRGGSTTQLYIDTDGSLTAGDGAVTLNSQGISIEVSTGGERRRSYNLKGSSDWIGWLEGTEDANSVVVTLSAYGESGVDGKLFIAAETEDAGDISQIYLYTAPAGTPTSSITMLGGPADEITLETDNIYLAGWVNIDDGAIVGDSTTTPQDKSLGMVVRSGNPSTLANVAQLFAKDVSSSAELFAMDEAGNVTQLSPHDPVTGEWIFYSQNVKTGRTVRIDMEKLVRAVEEISGKKFMQVSN